MNDLLIPGFSIAILISIIAALHGITQQQIKNLEQRLDRESNLLREETTKPAQRLAEALSLAEESRKEQLSSVEKSLRFEIESMGKILGCEIQCKFNNLK